MSFPKELPIDASQLEIAGSGAVPVQEWAEVPGGGRRPTGNQAKHEESGLPLWNIVVMMALTDGTSLGSSSVQIAAATQPAIGFSERITFTGMRANIWSGKGGLAGRFEAESVATISDTKSAPSKRSADSAAA